MKICRKMNNLKNYPATTNYPPDTHKEFCARCFKKHGHCPSTGTKLITAKCTL